MCEVDKKNKGYFTFNDLIKLLQEFQFKEDTEQELLHAFQELDHDADGLIHKDTLANFLITMGEVFNSTEITEFMNAATDRHSENEDMININRLSKVLLPKLKAQNDLLKLHDNQ